MPRSKAKSGQMSPAKGEGEREPIQFDPNGPITPHEFSILPSITHQRILTKSPSLFSPSIEPHILGHIPESKMPPPRIGAATACMAALQLEYDLTTLHHTHPWNPDPNSRSKYPPGATPPAYFGVNAKFARRKEQQFQVASEILSEPGCIVTGYIEPDWKFSEACIGMFGASPSLVRWKRRWQRKQEPIQLAKPTQGKKGKKAASAASAGTTPPPAATTGCYRRRPPVLARNLRWGEESRQAVRHFQLEPQKQLVTEEIYDSGRIERRTAPFTEEEKVNLKRLIQQEGKDFHLVSSSLHTGRTPAECIRMYQLNKTQWGMGKVNETNRQLSFAEEMDIEMPSSPGNEKPSVAEQLEARKGLPRLNTFTTPKAEEYHPIKFPNGEDKYRWEHPDFAYTERDYGEANLFQTSSFFNTLQYLRYHPTVNPAASPRQSMVDAPELPDLPMRPRTHPNLPSHNGKSLPLSVNMLPPSAPMPEAPRVVQPKEQQLIVNGLPPGQRKPVKNLLSEGLYVPDGTLSELRLRYNERTLVFQSRSRATNPEDTIAIRAELITSGAGVRGKNGAAKFVLPSFTHRFEPWIQVVLAHVRQNDRPNVEQRIREILEKACFGEMSLNALHQHWGPSIPSRPLRMFSVINHRPNAADALMHIASSMIKKPEGEPDKGEVMPEDHENTEEEEREFDPSKMGEEGRKRKWEDIQEWGSTSHMPRAKRVCVALPRTPYFYRVERERTGPGHSIELRAEDRHGSALATMRNGNLELVRGVGKYCHPKATLPTSSRANIPKGADLPQRAQWADPQGAMAEDYISETSSDEEESEGSEEE